MQDCVAIQPGDDCRWDILAVPAFLSPRPPRPSPHQSLLCARVHMAIDVSAVAVLPQAAVSTAGPEAESFDQRWAAWLAKGAAHDRAAAEDGHCRAHS